MTDAYRCLITENKIVVTDALNFVAAPENGATASFVGIIRNHNLGKTVVGVSYDVHEKLTQKIFYDICYEAAQHYGEPLKIYIVHFKGRLEIGGVSVVIAVGSPHRDEAFKACRYIIEAVKHRCPIWKQEHYTDGNTQWVKGHALCC